MADFTALKTAIQNAIKQNGNEEITGDILQGILLSIVTTLGDSAINDLVSALGNEVNARQQADGTLQQNITDEAIARGNADTALSNRLGSTITAENTAADQIGEEAEARAAADSALQGLIDGITDNIENGYVYAGIATPSSTPVTGKVFYLALTAGTYTNFGSTVVSQGINILKYNGSAWSLDVFVNIDDEPTNGSDNLVNSKGIKKEIQTLANECINICGETLQIPTGTHSTTYNLKGRIIAGKQYFVEVIADGSLGQTQCYISTSNYNGEVIDANILNFGSIDLKGGFSNIFTATADANNVIVWCANVTTAQNTKVNVYQVDSDAYTNKGLLDYCLNGFGKSKTESYSGVVFAFAKFLDKKGYAYVRIQAEANIRSAIIYNGAVNTGMTITKNWKLLNLSSLVNSQIYLDMSANGDVTLEYITETILSDLVNAKANSGIVYVGKGLDFETLQEAIDNAGDTPTHPVTIFVSAGSYEMPNYSRDEFLAKTPRRNLSIIGVDRNKCVIYNNVGAYGDMLNGDFIDSAPIKFSGNILLKNLTIKSVASDEAFIGDARYKSYSVHIDSSVDANSIVEIDNCTITNDHDSCIGFGCAPTMKIIIKNSYLESTMHDISTYHGTIWGHDLPWDNENNGNILLENNIIVNKNANKALAVIAAYATPLEVLNLRNIVSLSNGAFVDGITLSPNTQMTKSPLCFGNNNSSFNV